jgi:hypothetical protein
MRLRSLRTFAARHRRAQCFAWVLTVGLAASAYAQAPTAYGWLAMIGPITQSSKAGTEETIEPEIHPRGHRTAWEIRLDCPSYPQCQAAQGQLPADSQEGTVVTAVFTGLKPSVVYYYKVIASNSSGEEVLTGEFTVQPIPPGVSGGDPEPYHPPELPWANQSGDEAALRTVAEQTLKEQAAKEAAARLEAEETARREAASRTPNPITSSCVVPALQGDTLVSARRALSRAHCRLGAVHQPVHHHGTLRVRKQSVQDGKRLANSARVALWMGPGR